MPVNKLNLSSEAKNDLAEIKAYISMELNNPQAAVSTLKKITKTMRMLRDHAAIGVPLYAVTHDDDGSQRRFLTGGNYIIFYRSFKDNIYIDRVLYSRRDYMRILFGDI